MTAPASSLGRSRLRGLNAIVTGAAQGIGRATALRLAAEGADVTVNDLPGHPALESVREAVGGRTAAADVSDREALDAALREAERARGGFDIAVANAAAMTMAPFGEEEPHEWWRQVDVNLTGTFNLIQAVLPGMARRGRGRIVVIASEWGVTGWPNATGYAASKAGLVAMIKSLGLELAPRGIGVNGVAPGITDTPQLDVDAGDAGVSSEEIRRRYAAVAPLRRITSADEIAAAVAFLASSESEPMIGQLLQPNGGTTRCRA